MSADATAAIGPVSARYAAQIRELLYAQALQRMAADREAARASAQAERHARAEVERQTDPEPIKAKMDAQQPATPNVKPEPAPATTAPAQLVDIQA